MTFLLNLVISSLVGGFLKLNSNNCLPATTVSAPASIASKVLRTVSLRLELKSLSVNVLKLKLPVVLMPSAATSALCKEAAVITSNAFIKFAKSFRSASS